MKVTIFFEGGGDKRSNIAIRSAWRGLFERAGFQRKPEVRGCGSRQSAFENFSDAHATWSRSTVPILLVDSESPVKDNQKVWAHLKERDGWDRPKKATEDQAQLMIQCMETWMVADRQALSTYFHQGFNENSLPALNDLESRGKADVQAALENATRACGRDRKYRKGKRSFELLGRLSPDVLMDRLPHVRELFRILGLPGFEWLAVKRGGFLRHGSGVREL